MNEMERLRHFVREIEELTTLWQELVRFSVPANELATRRHALLERLESLAHEMYGVRHLIEPLVTHVERFREMIIECKWPAPTETLPSRGRVFPTPGRPTATVEVLVTSGLDWRLARTAMLADRTVDIVEQGTTRPGPVVAGSRLRVELSVAPEAVARSRSVQDRIWRQCVDHRTRRSGLIWVAEDYDVEVAELQAIADGAEGSVLPLVRTMWYSAEAVASKLRAGGRCGGCRAGNGIETLEGPVENHARRPYRLPAAVGGSRWRGTRRATT